MIRSIALASLLVSASGCSKTTRFEVKNDTEQALEAVAISKSGDPKTIGTLEPGEVQVVEFQAIFENRYRLTYEQGGKRLWKDLCYQAWGYKADGTVSIRPEGVLLTCR
jgi:hypothetical protein